MGDIQVPALVPYQIKAPKEADLLMILEWLRTKKGLVDM
jgi:hypothetical protein